MLPLRLYITTPVHTLYNRQLLTTHPVETSCKLGSAKFSYTASLRSTQVFNALTGQSPDAKKPKMMLSFESAEFQRDIAKDDVSASVRHVPVSLILAVMLTFRAPELESLNDHAASRAPSNT